MITPYQILTFCVYSAAIALAIYFGDMVAEDALFGLVKIVGAIGGLLWLSFGSTVWWLPLFVGLGLGGQFYFGFKILTHEAGLLAGAAALLPSAVLMRIRSFPHRGKLPLLLTLFLIYLVFHCVWSLWQYSHFEIISIGSVGRLYFTAAWGPIFLLAFNRYGSSKHLHWALYTIQGAFLLRTISGIVFFFTPSLAYLPGVNFVLPGIQGGGDLRMAGMGLGEISLAMLFIRHGFLQRMFHRALILLAMTALFMDGGRGAFISFFCVFFCAAFLSRNRLARFGLPVALAALLLAVNLYPTLIDRLPSSVGRATSVLIVSNRHTVSQEETEASNRYHEIVNEMGKKRWLSSPRSFFFGVGVKPYDWSIFREKDGDKLWQLQTEAAADSGNYECAFWEIAAIMGTIGLSFYLLLFGTFWKRLWGLRKIADHYQHGRCFLFLAVAMPLQWMAICYWTGNVPSYELTMLGLAFIYLSDRAWEEEERKKAESVAAPLLPQPLHS